jgi:hypothetical protein
MTQTRRNTVAEKPAKQPVKKRTSSSRAKTTKRRQPSHLEISERAYYIHLDEGVRDELGNWLRAERELTAA